MDKVNEYKIRFYQDNTYEVWLIDKSDDDDARDISMFQGSLMECESWIRLAESDYI